MVEITVRKNLTMIVKGCADDDSGTGTFRVPRDGVDIKVCVDYATRRVACLTPAFTVSAKTYEVLRSDSSRFVQENSPAIPAEIKSMSRRITSAAQIVLSLLKYHLGHASISESLFAHVSTEWTEDDENWTMVPMETFVAGEGRSVMPLNERSTRYIQEHIDSGILPLIGTRHLHRARNEPLPHYKWIDATTAAELCIKEIFIRKNPAIERLLLEVPSPPIHKLYGSLLEHYLGERSPRATAIKKGVELRNKLIHSPSTHHVDLQDAIIETCISR